MTRQYYAELFGESLCIFIVIYDDLGSHLYGDERRRQADCFYVQTLSVRHQIIEQLRSLVDGHFPNATFRGDVC